MKKKLCCILAGAMLMSTLTLGGVTVSANDQTEVSNTSPHWGESYISRAKSEGILSGIGAEERDPNAAVTRAEFVKMTLVAMRLYPGCDTLESFDYRLKKQNMSYVDKISEPGDMTNHPLTKDGYTEAALNLGLLNSENCTDGLFHPDEPITRYDAAKIASRMVGLVYTANHGNDKVPFTDSISEGNVGTVAALAAEKILLGYEDNTMRGDNTITLAEACAVLDRCIEYSEHGIDKSITVKVNGEVLTDSAPVQIIDGIMYVPYIPVLISANKSAPQGYNNHYHWNPEEQSYFIINGKNCHYIFYTGSTVIDFCGNIINEPNLAKNRLMRGEFMIPVYNIQTQESICVPPGERYLNQPYMDAFYNKDKKLLDLKVAVGYAEMYS